MSNSPLVTRLGYADPSNYTEGRQQTLRGIVIHHAVATNIDSVIRTFQRAGRNGSAHYCVCDNEVALIVDEWNTAWHCSNWNGNCRTIGIEVCNSTLDPDYKISDASWKTLVKLVADIAKRNGFGRLEYLPDGDGTGITGHKDWQGASTACVPLDETEVLTPKGFKMLSEITLEDEVAQWDKDTGIISFAKPIGIIEPYEAEVTRVRDTELTDNHQVFDKRIHSKRDENRGKWLGDFEKVEWGSKNRFSFPFDTFYNGEGLDDLTEDEIELLVWIQADGHYMYDDRKNNRSYYGIEFHFAKERKIARMEALLDSMGIPYKETKQSNGTTKIRIYGKEFVEWSEKYLDDKHFTNEWMKLDYEQFNRFYEAIFLADGCVKNMSYSSSDKRNSDIVQAIFTLNDSCCHMGNDNRVYTGSNAYCLDKRFGYSKRTTLVGCLTMPKGSMVIRQYGRTQIVGNCPGPYLYPRLAQLAKEANDINYPEIEWRPMGTPRNMRVIAGGKLVDIKTNATIVQYDESTDVFMVERGYYNGITYYRSQYSHDKGIANGFKEKYVTEVPVEPEPVPTPDPTPEPTPEPEPTPVEPEPTPEPKKSIWQIIIEFIIKIFTIKKGKK